MKRSQEFITLSALKLRGWTDSKILQWLGEPDKTAPNPHGRNAPQVKLFLLSRVERKEKGKKWMEWSEKTKDGRAKLSDSLKKNADEKRVRLLEYVTKIKIKIPIWEESILYQKACAHYNDLWESRGNLEKEASINSSKDFLKRIAVNMLRHEYSQYEDEINEMFGKIGKQEAYIELKNLVLDKIAESYTFLSNECNNQKINL
jgi:hypothetical protein